VKPIHLPTTAPAPASLAATSVDPAGDLRALTSKRIAELVADQAKGGFVDVAELVKLAGVLKALDHAEPERRQELDLSGISDSALEELVAAEKTSVLMRDWSPERKAAYHEERQAKAKADELERHKARRDLQELAHVGKIYLMGQADERCDEVRTISARLGLGASAECSKPGTSG
jgi:hypothetical protein